MSQPPNLAMLNAAITDLAKRLESLDHRVGTGGAGIGSRFDTRLRGVEHVLGLVRKEVAKLVQAKAQTDADAELRQPWDTLSAEHAEKRWLDLAAWVQWFVARNNIGSKEIPDCWYLHGGLVDELEALRWAWNALNKPDGKGTEPLAWREAMNRARARWPMFNPNGCTSTHSQTRSRALGNESDWRDFLAEELADRPADRTEHVSSRSQARPGP